VQRARLLLVAQAAFYWSIGLFVFSALVSLLGATLSQSHPHWLFAFGLLAFVVGFLATGSLVFGCVQLVRETRIAMQSLGEEKRILFALHGRRAEPPEGLHHGLHA
jgi:hypothetical protein